MDSVGNEGRSNLSGANTEKYTFRLITLAYLFIHNQYNLQSEHMMLLNVWQERTNSYIQLYTIHRSIIT